MCAVLQKCFIQHAALHATIAKVAAYFSGEPAAQAAEQDLSAARTTAKTVLERAQEAHDEVLELERDVCAAGRPRGTDTAGTGPQQAPTQQHDQAASAMANIDAAVKPKLPEKKRTSSTASSNSGNKV